jgi:hypothetical protein
VNDDFANDLWKWATKQEIVRTDSSTTPEQDERLFYAQVAKEVCAKGYTIDRTNEALRQIIRVFDATGSRPFWLHELDDQEFLTLQLLADCAPEQFTPAAIVATQVSLAEASAMRRALWWVGGAAVGGAALVGLVAFVAWPSKKRRRRRRLR